jgi:3-oxoacyl-[acyl-carrier protein] reductase
MNNEGKLRTDMAEGRIAIVTGASKGIGRAIAMQLRANSYNVIEFQRTEADVKVDLANPENVDVAWGEFECMNTAGLDLLVVNAGVSIDAPFVDSSLQMIQEMYSLNVFSALRLIQNAVKYWVRNERLGHIVLIGSQAALPGAKQSGNVVYTSTKGALHSIVGPLATEFGPRVRINCIAPGDVETEAELTQLLLRTGNNIGAFEIEKRRIAERSALGRWVKVEEIADAVVFLDRCRAVTGATLNVSAGSSVH